MIYRQLSTAIKKYEFDFTDYFPSTDTISSVEVFLSPATGPTEVAAQRSASGLVYTIAINASAATVGILYTLCCQATSSSGKVQPLYAQFVVVSEPTGASTITPTSAVAGFYIAVLSQSGTSAPTIVATNYNSLSAAIVWSRTGVGTYVGTLAGAFPANKTHVWPKVVQYAVGNEDNADGVRLTDNTVQITVRDFAGNLTDGFSGMSIRIETYA